MSFLGSSRYEKLDDPDVPVEIVESAATTATAITLVSPSGYRLEGLSLDHAIHALARLR